MGTGCSMLDTGYWPQASSHLWFPPLAPLSRAFACFAGPLVIPRSCPSRPFLLSAPPRTLRETLFVLSAFICVHLRFHPASPFRALSRVSRACRFPLVGSAGASPSLYIRGARRPARRLTKDGIPYQYVLLPVRPSQAGLPPHTRCSPFLSSHPTIHPIIQSSIHPMARSVYMAMGYGALSQMAPFLA